MRKIVVIDTSVLVHDPNSYRSFPGDSILISIAVIEELDKLKSFSNEVGKNARVCIRALEEICQSGDIHKGVQLENGSVLQIDAGSYEVNFAEDASYGDNKILACAINAKKGRVKKNVVLVSRDLNLRIRARALGLEAEGYEKNKTSTTSEIYSGFRIIENSELGDILISKSFIDVKGYEELEEMFPNECVNFISDNQEGIVLGRKIEDKIKIINNKSVWGLNAKNKEQAFSLDLLCDPSVSLVMLSGVAGTGKTLCAVAAGMEMVLGKKLYDKMVIYRPMEPVGRDVGFLPGELSEKLSPWFGPITDSFEFLSASKNKKGTNWQDKLSPQYTDKIEFAAMTYIRGRSISHSYILIDEIQNTTCEDVKTIISRSGIGTKIVCVGDPSQIDYKGLDAENNGLVYLIEKFKASKLAGSIVLEKGERSELAQEAANIL